MRIFCLFHRLFEAHFLPGHMAILVVASSAYTLITSCRPDTLGLAWTFELTAYLRVVGLVAMAFFILSYERYHDICVNAREEEMKSAGLAEAMHGLFSHRSWKIKAFDYLIFPIAAPIYGSIPAIYAQICHFWTLDLVYSVTRKPRVPRAKAESPC